MILAAAQAVNASLLQSKRMETTAIATIEARKRPMATACAVPGPDAVRTLHTLHTHRPWPRACRYVRESDMYMQKGVPIFSGGGVMVLPFQKKNKKHSLASH